MNYLYKERNCHRHRKLVSLYQYEDELRLNFGSEKIPYSSNQINTSTTNTKI